MQNKPIHAVRLLGSHLLALCPFGLGSTNLVSDPSWFDYTLERHFRLAVGAVPGDLVEPIAGRSVLYFGLHLAPARQGMIGFGEALGCVNGALFSGGSGQRQRALDESGFQFIPFGLDQAETVLEAAQDSAVQGFMAPEEGGLIKGTGGLRFEVGDRGVQPDGLEDAGAGRGGAGDEVSRVVGF